MQDEEMAKGKKQGAEALAEFLEYAAKGALTYRLSSEDAEEELPHVADYRKDPEQILESRQSNSLFRELVAELPEKDRVQSWRSIILMKNHFPKLWKSTQVCPRDGSPAFIPWAGHAEEEVS